MRASSADPQELAQLCANVLGEVRLGPEEAAVFLSAAAVLLPQEIASHLDVRAPRPIPETARAALRALWLRTGLGPLAPCPMPEHPLAPGVLGLCWRRLLSALGRPSRVGTSG